ncbi:hypothetical protein V1521DRAFT_484575 [Lipomyces starkeyi]
MDPLLRHNIPPIDSELETVDLTNCDAFDDAQHSETESNGRKLVVDATPIPNKDSEIKALIAPQPAIVRDTRKSFKFGDKYPERDEVLLLEVAGMEDKPYLSSHGDKMAGWKELADRVKERFETLMKQQAEHMAYLEKASGIEVEITDLISIREDVYELVCNRLLLSMYIASTEKNSKKATAAERERAKVQADNLGKTIRDVAMRRLSEKRFRRSKAGDRGQRTTKKRKIGRSSDETTDTEEALLKHGDRLERKFGEAIDILRDLQSQGRQILDAMLRRED